MVYEHEVFEISCAPSEISSSLSDLNYPHLINQLCYCLNIMLDGGTVEVHGMLQLRIIQLHR